MIKNKSPAVVVLSVLLLYSLFTHGQTINQKRAHYNYMMFCQGCHQPDGMGTDDDIPEIKDYIGYFLNVDKGREFLVRVPGSANAPINDEQLAELLNWIMHNFSGPSLPENFQSYTAEEVGKLRKQPLIEVTRHRAALVEKINRYLEHQPGNGK